MIRKRKKSTKGKPALSPPPQEPAPRQEIPTQPVEILAQLLRETRYTTEQLIYLRRAQEQVMELMQQQLKALRRITTAAEVWLILVILGLLAGLASCCLGMDTLARIR